MDVGRRLFHFDPDPRVQAQRLAWRASPGKGVDVLGGALRRRVRWLPFGLSDAPLSRLLVGVAVVIVLAMIPMLDRNSSHISAFADTGYVMILAFGLNIIVGYTGLLALGFAAFFAIGSYTYAFLASPQYGVHLSFWPMLLVSAAVAAIFGLLLGAPTLRLRGDYLAIVTLGFGEIVPQVFQNLDKYTGGPDGIAGIDQPRLFGYAFGFNPTPYYYLYFVIIVICLVLLNNLRNSRVGRTWMAIREDELAAEHMGINTTSAKLLAFSLGSAFAGVAGVIYAAKLSTVSPSGFDFNTSVMILAAIVLGGMGNLIGVLFGSAIIGLLNFFVLPQSSNWAHSLGTALHMDFLQGVDLNAYRFMIYGIILVLVMLFRPEGLVPSAARRAELHAEQEAGAGIALQEQAEFGADIP
ncbi:MAG: branched-chain amino acid ABC transporter permease [Candidatus Eremiobacteraeota bacterium]|nr:branched-chain amino acid ABC transporter permease [Candidatus Eremiobacteraeota bacterium]MBC5827688.1 branched-chain amino acid ABC transporter permease [Candidatus Eremiobacteraeota bacterium]